MSENSSRVTVKRVTNVPSRFYVQVPQTERSKTAETEQIKETKNELTIEKSAKKPLKETVKRLFSGVFAFGKETVSKLSARARSGAAFIGDRMTEKAKNLSFSICVSAGVALFACLLLCCTCSLGCQVSVDGSVLGVAKNKEAYQDIVSQINHELSYLSPEPFTLDSEPTLSLKLIPKGQFTDEAVLREALKSARGDMLPAYGIYADGRLLFAMPNETMAKTVLNDYQKNFTNGRDDVTAAFCETVSVRSAYVPKSSLSTVERAAEQLADGQIVFHTVAEGETLEMVAQTYDVFLEDLYKTNRTSLLSNPVGQTLRIATGKPLLSVKTTERMSIEEEIPFATVEQDNPEDYEGSYTTLQTGQTGCRLVDAYVTSVNGQETERKVISETVIANAVDEIVGIGTKTPPSPIGTGSLSLPVNGSLSSRYGSRWGRNHEGVDFSANTGTNIYAADNGKVVYSEYNDGGYGYMIQIDHGNGIVTYYAHCSELLVAEGTVVGKGDLIAKVGNTGRSTGPHLHFEVRQNGVPIDPAAYLKEIA